MRENVGKQDQLFRAVSGPLLMLYGYRHRDSFGGLLTLLAGAALTQTAVSRVCPVNALLGIDTTAQHEHPEHWRRSSIIYAGQHPPDIEASTGLPPIAEAQGEQEPNPAPD